MRSLFSIMMLFVAIKLRASSEFSVGLTADDSIGYVQLFDLTEKWYGPGSRSTHINWEEEFIAFAKKTEQTPHRYIKHVMSWFDLSEEEKTLATYRLNYIFASGQYSLEFFRNSDYEDDYTRNGLREAYLFTHITRSDENIRRLWGIFGPMVKKIASPILADGRIERTYLQGLLDSWECIKSKKGYKKKLSACFKKLEAEKPNPYAMLDYVQGLICDDIQDSFGVSDQRDYTTNTQWLFTF